jgi:hypothetical protein
MLAVESLALLKHEAASIYNRIKYETVISKKTDLTTNISIPFDLSFDEDDSSKDFSFGGGSSGNSFGGRGGW